MKKILIISFYELKEYLYHIKELFESYYFEVINYPLLQYAYDVNDKIQNYHVNMNEYIDSNNPDIVLWWFIDVPVEVFKYIKSNHPSIFYIMYNMDDPINLNNDTIEKAKIFDMVVTPCENSINVYKTNSNVKYVIFGPVGYDKSLFVPIFDPDNMDYHNFKNKYECDISLLCYNMYLDKDHYSDQLVYKRELINNIIALCRNKDYKLKLYGTYILGELYPQYYFGDIPYHEKNFLFNFSKINLVSSPSKNKSLCICENVFQILGSGGLLMIDEMKNIDKIFKDNQNCIIYNQTNYLDKITEILSDYNSYKHIRKNSYILSKNYSWDVWTENIIKYVGFHFFDEKIYRSLYDKNDLNRKHLIDEWMTNGVKKKEICFDFTIPYNFNADEYIDDKKIKNDPKFAYMHWIINNKDPIYMKIKTKNIDLVNPDVIDNIEDYYNVCSILNKVIKYNTRDTGLDELNDYCEKTPYIKINEFIDSYVTNTL